MNSRLFLYSAFFFVTILLYDSYSYKDQTVIPIDDVEEPSYRTPPPAENSPEVSEDRKPDSDETYTFMDGDRSAKKINIESDNLKVSIDLSDGSIVRAELKKFKDSFGGDSNVVLLDADSLGYRASSDVQLSNLKSPGEYTSEKEVYVAETYPFTVAIASDNLKYSITKKYTFYESSHLIKVENEVYNKSSNSIQARYYNTIQR